MLTDDLYEIIEEHNNTIEWSVTNDTIIGDVIDYEIRLYRKPSDVDFIRYSHSCEIYKKSSSFTFAITKGKKHSPKDLFNKVMEPYVKKKGEEFKKYMKTYSRKKKLNSLDET
jgi:hypothetical protein